MSKTILIVEDNDKNLKLMRDLLAHHGFNTLEAGNAEDGIVLANETSPDLVVMDIRLPGMSGNEAMQVLKSNDRTSGIPAIAVTASVMEKDKQDIEASGFNAYLEKPFDHKEFIGLVKQLVGESA